MSTPFANIRYASLMRRQRRLRPHYSDVPSLGAFASRDQLDAIILALIAFRADSLSRAFMGGEEGRLHHCRSRLLDDGASWRQRD